VGAWVGNPSQKRNMHERRRQAARTQLQKPRYTGAYPRERGQTWKCLAEAGTAVAAAGRRTRADAEAPARAPGRTAIQRW